MILIFVWIWKQLRQNHNGIHPTFKVGGVRDFAVAFLRLWELYDLPKLNSQEKSGSGCLRVSIYLFQNTLENKNKVEQK